MAHQTFGFRLTRFLFRSYARLDRVPRKRNTEDKCSEILLGYMFLPTRTAQPHALANGN